MKRLTAVITLGMCLIVLSPVHAAPITYTFNPYDGSGQTADINDLDHTKYYVWEITNFSLGANEVITGAALTFTNIYDWTVTEPDILYLNLLDATPTTMPLATVKSLNGVDADGTSGSATYNTRLLQGTDYEAGGDKFAGMGVEITPAWTDLVGGSWPGHTLVYDFAALGTTLDSGGNIVPGTNSILPYLTSYISNGNNFSFGIDPDCHYYNDMVTFTITTDTRAVPEPGTFLLLGSGLIGLGFLRRKKLKNQ